MKKYLFLCWCCLLYAAFCHAQSPVYDESIIYQQQRMVYDNWDQDKFTPTHGFLWLNPYYWLVWGFFYPDYHENDLRPLSDDGPETQRIALVADEMNSNEQMKYHSDTVRNTALSQVSATSGVFSDADPLWWLYYSHEFEALLDYSPASILGRLPPQVSAKLVSEGTYDWYTNELAMLRERVNGAHSADIDRGARILAYYRLLQEYRVLNGVWAIRTSAAQKDLQLTAQQQQVKTGQFNGGAWTPQTDVQIARKVLLHANY